MKEFNGCKIIADRFVHDRIEAIHKDTARSYVDSQDVVRKIKNCQINNA